MASKDRELQCVARLKNARPKPAGFVCESIPVSTDKALHYNDAFSSFSIVPSSSTSSSSSQPSLQKLVDLSSGHGTWVSDRKVDPRVCVELNERDALGLGDSTRSFDFQNQIVSPNFENPLPPDEIEEDTKLLNDNLIPFEQVSPSALPMPEFTNYTLSDHVQEEGASYSYSVSPYRSNVSLLPRENTPCLWSRLGQAAGFPQSQSGWSRGGEMRNGMSLFLRRTQRAFLGLNLAFGRNFLVKMGLLIETEEEVQASFIPYLSSNGGCKDKYTLTISEEEYLAPIVLHDFKMKKPLSESRPLDEPEMTMTRRKSGKLRFQFLIGESSKKGKSEAPITPLPRITSTSPTSRTRVICDQIRETTVPFPLNHSFRETSRNWYMVVDTDCLLNKESRKSLQLLQGLKGTQLIIPKIVVRELDYLNRKFGGLFRRMTKVSSVWQWIEKCMVETKWWIYVQNSIEENTIFPPEHSSFPQTMPFSMWGTSEKIASATTDDHILLCALFFKNVHKNDGQVVLLSDNISLKIKAITEGLLCESAKAFRESLVNPSSTRFLWPSGLRWPSLEEAGLRKNVSVKNMASQTVEGETGLKLILLDNSHCHTGKMK